MISLSWFKTRERERNSQQANLSSKGTPSTSSESDSVFTDRLGHSAVRAPGASSSVPASGLPVTLKTNLKGVWIWIWRMLSWAIYSWTLTEYQITQKIEWMWSWKEIKKHRVLKTKGETDLTRNHWGKHCYAALFVFVIMAKSFSKENKYIKTLLACRHAMLRSLL